MRRWAATGMASALLVLASAAAFPSMASAGTVSVSDAVVFTDPAGQDNRVDVDTGDVVGCETAWCVTIEDDVGAPASSDPRCEAVGADELLCQLAGPLPVVVDLGAGQDLLAAFQQPTDALTGRGGPGNDSLYSTTGPATLEGGDGDDELYPDDNPYSSSTVTPGPDVIAGGPGVDKVWYIGHASGVQVSLDGAANDGGVGEVDNVQTDVEAIVGSRSDDVLVGSDANNVFEGREGHDRMSGGGGADSLSGESENDQLDGGDGDDTLIGGSDDDTLIGAGGTDSFNGDSPDLFYAGNDTIDAVDGLAEPVSCGPGADLARVDPADRIGDEAQDRCETVERSKSAGKQAFASIGRLSLAGSRVRVKVSCRVTDAVGCNGRLTLRSAKKVRVRGRKRTLTLGRASFSLDPGATRTVRVKLSRTARTAVRRAGRMRVRAIAKSTRPNGLRSQRTLTLRAGRRGR